MIHDSGLEKIRHYKICQTVWENYTSIWIFELDPELRPWQKEFNKKA